MAEIAEAPAELDAVGVQKILAGIAAKDAQVRAGDVPAGQALYDQDIGGMKMRRTQPRGLINYDGKPLPDRVLIYNRYSGAEKRVSTTLLARKLAILLPPDEDGVRLTKFVAEKPDLPPTEYIDETCEVCLRNGVRKRFERKWDYVGHMEQKHQREWRVLEAERSEREAISPEALVQAIANLDPAIKKKLFGQGEHHATEEAAHCDACGWEGKPTARPDASLAAHTRLHCPGSGSDAKSAQS